MADYWSDPFSPEGMRPGNYGDTLSFLGNRIDRSSVSVLDLGCNRGWLAAFFKNYTGFDNNPGAIIEARAFWSRKYGWSKEEAERRFRIWDAQSGAPLDEKFDLVVCKDLVEHLQGGHEFLQWIREVLKPNGFLLLVTPDAQSWVWDDPSHIRPYSRKAHRALARAHGFRIIRETFESVMPGTQHLARLFGSRSPLPVRILTHIPWWRRNVVTLMQI